MKKVVILSAMPKKNICNKCGVQQNEFLTVGGRDYCKRCNSVIISNNKYNNQQGYNPYLDERGNNNNERSSIGGVSVVDNLSAYDRKTTHDIFLMTMEWLEKYIEVAGYYPDWENRKQLKNNNIKRKDIYGNPGKAENSLSTQLVLFKDALDDDPSFLREEVKKDFYRWINATRIDADNCPERLRHFLFGVNEILEGKGEKIQRDIENRQRSLDPNSPEYMEQMSKLFVHIQTPMHNESEAKKSLKGKTYKDIEIRNRFSGSEEIGEKAFGRIASGVAGCHDDFYFFPQKGRQQSSSSSNIPLTNFQIIQDVKNNPQNWRIEDIITAYGGTFSNDTEETVLIGKDARLDDYSRWTSKLNFDNNPIFRKTNFSDEEWTEIERAKGISQTSIRWELVSKINQHRNEFSLENMLVLDEKCNYNEEEWLIHNSAERKSDENGCLVFDANKMIKIKELSESEKKSIGYKSEQSLQSSSVSTNQKDNKEISTGKVLGILGIISVAVIASAVVVKKQLNKKVKRV